MEDYKNHEFKGDEHTLHNEDTEKAYAAFVANVQKQDKQHIDDMQEFKVKSAEFERKQTLKRQSSGVGLN